MDVDGIKSPIQHDILLSPEPHEDILLSPEPQEDILNAELLEDSIEIKKLNERIDNLEGIVKVCCPEKGKTVPKSKTVPKKYTAYTENWVYLPQTSAFPGENSYPTRKSIEQGKKYTLAHDEGGFDWARGIAWIKSNTKEEVLADASNKGSKYKDAIKNNDTVYIVPGIDIKLLVDKSKEGYSIEFESDKDRMTFLEMGGEQHNLKGSSKKKKKTVASKKKKKSGGYKKSRSSKKKKKSRSSKKKKKSLKKQKLKYS
jgi:hypothetical protein